MTISLNLPENGRIGHIAVRRLMRELGVDQNSVPGPVSKMMRALFPLDGELANHVRENVEASLTELADPSGQIRFFRLERLDRNHFEILQYITSLRGPQEVHITGEHPDELSRRFLRAASRSHGWMVTHEFQSESRAESAFDDALTDRERSFLELRDSVAKNPGVEGAEMLADNFADYLNSGDPWTVAELGRDCLSDISPGRLLRNVALAHVLTDRTEAAEKYYDLWYRSADKIGKARALYGIAMLYTRRHPPGLRSLSRAEEALQTGFELIRDVKEHDSDLTFDRVFNRNGYALILFRRGRTQDAIDLIEWGISQLSLTEEHIAIHRSVLIYNLAQCYRQLGDSSSEGRALERLLEVDERMPEYWLEYSKYLTRSGLRTEAHEAAERAVALGGGIGEAYAIRGKCELALGKYSKAIGSYESACISRPERVEWRIDQCFSMIKDGRLAEALSMLSSLEPPSDPKQRCRWSILRARSLDMLGSTSQATELLREASLEPWSEDLRGELSAALNAMSRHEKIS